MNALDRPMHRLIKRFVAWAETEHTHLMPWVKTTLFINVIAHAVMPSCAANVHLNPLP
jgi:hypothetical protein